MNTNTAMRYIRDHYAQIIGADSIETAHKMKMVATAYMNAWAMSGPLGNEETEVLYKEIEAVYNATYDKLCHM
jgi:hypothetical protein